MNLSIKTSKSQVVSQYNWIAKVDRVKYDGYKFRYLEAVAYGQTEEHAYNKLKDNLEKMGHTVIKEENKITPRIKTDELGWSEIVNLIGNEDISPAEILTEIALDKQSIEKDILIAETKLQRLKTKELQLKTSALHVMKYTKKEFPLVVINDGFIVVVTKDEITIESNVIK
ncbi:hypothetical protein Phi13:2_gp062 [Cellulophaga phage phi13:2]|uniref:Uncharacterized protein n=1 Tax=Cellulophaga phage phi13:2 TaxID=1328030 RepID=S0A5M0_9CAUD|nr:hypothetical protein Phi13:2_gp062 [Cellulophaga phage phi13:2]AGO49672.1 hypothetical protein Phi13:2_gp062 [Cellulophaga phage phi13:2]